MIKIDCLYPVTIVNPRWRECCIHFDRLCFPGGCYVISPLLRHSLFDKTSVFQFFSFRVNYKSLPDEQLDQYYFLSDEGETEPLFTKVPCGKCDICESKRQNSILQRLLMASQQSKLTAMFVTLTYNDVSLPSDGVNKRDCINFKKRFRTYAERYLGLDSEVVRSIKFAIFPEYGKSDPLLNIIGRPHYHVIIFGCPQFVDDYYENYYKWTRFVRFCWRFSITDCRPTDELNNFDVYQDRYSQIFNITPDYDPLSMGFVNVNFTSDTKALSYVSKYVVKGCDVPEGQNPLFHPLLSVNLGVDFVKDNFDYDEYFRTLKMKYLNIYTGQTCEVSLTSYYLKKIFPSWSQMVSSDFRKHYYSAVSQLQSFVKTPHLVPSLKYCCLGVLEDIYAKFPFMPLFEDAYADVTDKDIIYQCQDAFDNTTLEDFTDDGDLPIYFYFPSLAEDLLYLNSYEVDIGLVNEVQAKRAELFLKFPERNDQSDRALKFQKTINQLKDKVKL